MPNVSLSAYLDRLGRGANQAFGGSGRMRSVNQTTYGDGIGWPASDILELQGPLL